MVEDTSARDKPAPQPQKAQQEPAPADEEPEMPVTRTTPEEEAALREAASQRRRLSVAPKQVGDVSADGPEPLKGSLPEETPAAAEEKEEEKAKGVTQEQGSDFVAVFRTKKGYVPYNSNKVNQDRQFVIDKVGGNQKLAAFAVMDGHGEFGHTVAQFVAETLGQTLIDNKDGLVQDTERVMIDAVEDTATRMANTNINAAFSGTTLVLAVKNDRSIYVGNVGDSRCVIYQGSRALPLSEDQKPDNPKEKERIIAAGGRVEPLPGPPGEDNGPNRVWLAEVDVPGLAMSRSIGDEVSHTVGVISTPEVTKHEMSADDKFMILASDGVWEFISDQEACEIVNRYVNTDLGRAAEELVHEAQKRWQQEEEVVDDITCVVVKFQ